ncbi:acyl carrier protein [Streptomyces sp. NPDC057794]|uniref:acyl carrier protein n=1 Tax=Streptomyces sp. NPDC057794 TaxID=3346251 RepID=UPI0036791773
MVQQEAAVARILHSIVEATARHLGGDPSAIDSDADFFDLGADSLQMISVLRELEQLHQVKVTMRQLFEETGTPRRLAEFIAARTPDAGQTPARISAEWSAPTPSDAVPDAADATAPGVADARPAAPAPEQAPPAAPSATPAAPSAPEYATRQELEDLAQKLQQMSQIQLQMMSQLSQLLALQTAAATAQLNGVNGATGRNGTVAK